ncbi:MAG: sugar phosphate isomerase/epimerase [Candidatus Hydrogenedentes bacterium]|nr:sugar phosphate isomerase/epimerase [Candidatus Hydrogenedentota bacterium]
MISRRCFMKGAAITAAALVAADLPSAHAGELTGSIKKAVKYGMIRGRLSVHEKMALLKKLGFDGVEPGVGDKVEPAELKEAAAAAGIAIHGVVNGSVDNIPRAIDRAVFYGASSVLLVAGRVNESMSYEKNYGVTQDIIRAAIPYAGEKGIMLLVENVWNNFLLSPLEMARYIDELESDTLGVYFDIGNVVRFGWPEHWIRTLGTRIKKLDIKEYSREKQNDEGLWKGFDVKIGEGSVDWAAVRTELKALNYKGWGTAEVSGGEEDRLADISARMDRVLDL